MSSGHLARPMLALTLRTCGGDCMASQRETANFRRGLSVLLRVTSIFTRNAISPSFLSFAQTYTGLHWPVLCKKERPLFQGQSKPHLKVDGEKHRENVHTLLCLNVRKICSINSCQLFAAPHGSCLNPSLRLTLLISRISNLLLLGTSLKLACRT